MQLKISDLYLKLRTVENVVYRTSWMQQKGVRDNAFVNASKAMCAQMAVDAALTALQIHGGMGRPGLPSTAFTPSSANEASPQTHEF